MLHMGLWMLPVPWQPEPGGCLSPLWQLAWPSSPHLTLLSGSWLLLRNQRQLPRHEGRAALTHVGHPDWVKHPKSCPGAGTAPQKPPAARKELPVPKPSTRPKWWFLKKSHPGPALLNTLGHQPGKKAEFHTGRWLAKQQVTPSDIRLIKQEQISILV